ncbi:MULTISPECIES: PD-(D/E)XK nuclease family protein [unclassified Corallococcus]|uniref:PD-(D/E)XK nuclease family protein n=1 Tax=unclassified Corallococcus TaxID=2685029 RepID=UPI001A8E0F1D|nr:MULTISPECIES: PD-(D/E)XK nuclease family protein [unclassified Corallococcus]MBN9685233.1 PD-(D/E)XK nuclease family protein [Corallococcus sp. NCSPR001]WAS83310.1 PD-(D/E)XK nuclease family protein [Corallococcus sp. NCRR]
MTRPPPLPSPFERVEVPALFSPSRFGALGRCKLSVLGERSASVLLPPSLHALVGTLVHHVRRELSEGHWKAELSQEQACTLLMAEVTQQAEAQLAGMASTEALVPLREAMGLRTWELREMRLRRWASRLVLKGKNGPVRPLGDLMAVPTGQGPDTLRLETGDEAWLVAPSVRLRGRADRIEQTVLGTFDIIDFKSGRLHDEEGQLLPDATLQVRLYALAAEEAGAGAVRLFLEGDDRHHVPWGDMERGETRALLRTISTKLPAGKTLGAEDLAEAGPHCRGCRLRPSCRRYLEWGPKAWTHPQLPGQEPPLDVWGTLESVATGARGDTVELRDANGHLVIVDGVNPARELGAIAAGEPVYFFELERTEDRRAHGRVMHPRNFHEYPPDGGRRLRQARSLQAFRG